MNKYITVKKSQLSLYKDIPFYYLSKKGEGVLFKKASVFLDSSQISKAKTMKIFILSKDKDAAAKELLVSLNMDLARKIASKGLQTVRLVLSEIVEEVLTGSLDNSSNIMPFGQKSKIQRCIQLQFLI